VVLSLWELLARTTTLLVLVQSVLLFLPAILIHIPKLEILKNWKLKTPQKSTKERSILLWLGEPTIFQCTWILDRMLFQRT
jgi:hypothetical protein